MRAYQAPSLIRLKKKSSFSFFLKQILNKYYSQRIYILFFKISDPFYKKYLIKLFLYSINTYR